MGIVAAEIDAHLQSGGWVVTASDRAARALASDFHRARQAEGLRAWPAPHIFAWKSFVRAAWEQRAADPRLVLNPAQEQALWAEIAAADRSLATLLEGPRHRLAALAVEAHELLCSYAPQILKNTARSAWQQDAAAFSRWLAAFDETCRTQSLLSPSRLPHELIPLLAAESASRPPLLLAGFDRILPVQRTLLDTWGGWREAAQGPPAADVSFHTADDAQAELAACAVWCGRRLAVDPQARLLVVSQNAGARRGEIERAFLAHTGPVPRYEFSLGVPLGQIAPPRAALLLLRWLDAALAENELDWLFSTGFAAAGSEESASLAACMRALRRRGLERTHWTLTAFLSQRCAREFLAPDWIERTLAAQRLLDAESRRPQSPLVWAELVPRLLEELRFATARTLESAEFQALRRWQQTVETCGSLGFDGRRMSWKDFLAQLGRTLDETLFAPESRGTPIQIAGPAESAGLAADAIWFLGADEDAWPASAAMHPLLPVEIQREAGMPHATAQLDWELAGAITRRLLASAPEVHFSFARQNEKAEARPSRLIAQMAGQARDLPPELIAPAAPPPRTVVVEDRSRIPFPPGKVAGGSAVLTAQSQCPFRAFATARLNAQSWQPAQAGLTPSQRGSLLHEVLHSVWAGPPDGIRSSAELQALPDRQAFVAGHARRVFQQKLPAHLRERMPRRYLELEEQRLTRLAAEWLGYEAARVEFAVAETEVERSAQIDSLAFDLRLDRLDRLSDSSLLVIDYKSGDVSPTAWDLPRPDDVQLPLYAGFALGEDEELGGLVFAKIRPGEMKFAGRVGDAAATLFPDLKGTNPLVRFPLAAEQLLDWRDCIQQLAQNFLDGKAEVDPRAYPKTCEHCGLETLCRIQEQPVALARGRRGAEEAIGEEEDDE